MAHVVIRNTLRNPEQVDGLPISAENAFVPDDCIGIIIAFSQSKILFRGVNKKYMNMIENPARYKLEYLQAMKIKPSLSTLRIYFGKDDKTNVQKKNPFHISKIPHKPKNYCWAAVGKKGLRCKRRCEGKLCWQHICIAVKNHNDGHYWYRPGEPEFIAAPIPLFAAPRFQLK